MTVSPEATAPNCGGLLSRMYPRHVQRREEKSGLWPVTLMVHVGPHKTATTTIQAALAHNTLYLATRGVHVPPGVHPQFGGHHLLPLLLSRRSLTPLLGMTQSDVSASDLLDAWLTGARENVAHRVLVSSEAFCSLEEEEWLAFDRELQEAAQRTSTVVSRLVICFTRREIESRLKSIAGESYIHGATLPREELSEWLRTNLARQDATVERIPGLLSHSAEVSHIEFGGETASTNVAPSSDFVFRWFAHVLGAEDARGIVTTEEFSRLNPSRSARMLDELRAFNVLNNPPHADSVRPFARFDGDPELERAFARLNLVRSVFFEREATEELVKNLRAELAALADRSLRARIRRFVHGSRPPKDAGLEF